jgi:hypothetical protein
MGRASSGGSGHRRLGCGAGQSSGETYQVGGGAGQRSVWLGDGKVLTADKEDGGKLALGRPSRWLGLGSKIRSTASRVAPGRWLRRFPQ